MAAKVFAVLLLCFFCVLTCVSSQSSSFLRAANPTVSVSQPMSGTGTSFVMQSMSGAPNQRSAGAGAAVSAPSNTSTEKKNVHGVLSVVGWGILAPVGVYLGMNGCLISGCIFVVVGLWNVTDSPGITDSMHGILGILIFCFACLNWISFCGIRGDVVAVVLSIVNIYRGFHILQPDNHKWRDIYTEVLIILGCIAAVCEITKRIILLISFSS